MRACWLCLFACVFFVGCSDTEDKITLFEKGIRALSYEAYDVAVNYFERSCHAGFAKSCEQAAQLYQKGTGIKTDHPKALELLIEGCETDAQLCLLVAQYRSPEQSEQQAEQLHEEYTDKACKLGLISACEDLALQFEGRKAINYLRLACKNSGARCEGIRFHSFAGAFYYHQNQSERAIVFLDKACNEKDKKSCLLLGRALQEKGEFAAALSRFERACTLGEQESCSVLLSIYINGTQQIKPNAKKALEYRTKLCTLGNSQACLQIARDFANDKQNKAQAESFYRKALDYCTNKEECEIVQDELQSFKNPAKAKKPPISESRI